MPAPANSEALSRKKPTQGKKKKKGLVEWLKV
jgi:hypothetical protein